MTRAVSNGSIRVRRPRDRKQQIVVAASQLFRDRGYHNVSLAEVAGAMGMTAGALYRHFRNKEELLLHSVLDGLEHLDTMARGATDLDSYIHAAGAMSLERRGLAALWQREARHLPTEQREELRRRLADVGARISRLVRAERPELSAADAELLTWALLAVFACFGLHRITLPRKEFVRLYHRLSSVVVQVEFSAGVERLAANSGGNAAPGGIDLPRREKLLAEAIRLFDDRGFQSVNMRDIGAAAGIAGSSVYKHFSSKDELLVAALVRGSERMHAGMTDALAAGSTPRETLDLLLRAHIDFALDHSRLIGILVSEREELPEKERKATYRAQRDYLDVWTKLLGELQPGLTPAVAKILIDAVFTVINSLARTRRLTERPDLRPKLIDITSALLLSDV